MDERSRRRLTVARKVFGATRNPEFRDCLPIVDSWGERHIVIALRDDSLGYVFDRVDECGGAANIVVDLGMSVAVIAVTPDSPDSPDDVNAKVPCTTMRPRRCCSSCCAATARSSVAGSGHTWRPGLSAIGN